MSKYMQAADAIKREIVRLRGLNDAADVLEKIGSLDQAESDLRRAHAEITKQVAQSKVELEEARRQVDVALKHAQQIKMDSQGEAVEAKRRAEADRAKLLEAAEAEAERTASQAETKAREIIESAQKNKAGIDALAAQRESQAKDAQEKVSAAQMELADLQGRIERAKAEIKRMLGA